MPLTKCTCPRENRVPHRLLDGVIDPFCPAPSHLWDEIEALEVD